MEYIDRTVEKRLADMLARGRSALLLGARQTGKTTLAQRLNPDMQLNFIRPEVRQRYERRPELLGAEIESRPIPAKRKLPLVLLDEVQRVSELVNVVQDLIDRRAAQFILTGSSARKLRRGRDTNWLPGRLAPLRLDPLTLSERMPRTLEEGLLTRALPGIVSVADDAAREQDLRAYATLYLEEEIRAEALVRATWIGSPVSCNWLRLSPVASATFGARHRNWPWRTLLLQLLRDPRRLPHRRAGGTTHPKSHAEKVDQVAALPVLRPGRSPRNRRGRPASATPSVGWLV